MWSSRVAQNVDGFGNTLEEGEQELQQLQSKGKDAQDQMNKASNVAKSAKNRAEKIKEDASKSLHHIEDEIDTKTTAFQKEKSFDEEHNFAERKMSAPSLDEEDFSPETDESIHEMPSKAPIPILMKTEIEDLEENGEYSYNAPLTAAQLKEQKAFANWVQNGTMKDLDQLPALLCSGI